MAPAVLSVAQRRIEQEQWQSCVEWLGPYTPNATPFLFNRAHLFLHVKHSDVCPSVVLAQCLWVAGGVSATGGTPELVGEAGIGVPSEQDWECPRPPAAAALANAVVRIMGAREEYSRLARQRAVSLFDIQPWLARHEAVMREWMERRRS